MIIFNFYTRISIGLNPVASLILDLPEVSMVNLLNLSHCLGVVISDVGPNPFPLQFLQSDHP